MTTLATEIQEIESKAEAVASEVKTEGVHVVEEVKAEAVKIAGDVKADFGAATKAIEATIQHISAEEKLAIREIENTYLKAQIEINRLSQITQKAQQDFTKTVEDLTKKYVISPAEFVFDNVELAFKRK
jgi:formiminotetrahydrofolate cyclodeaminase